MRGAFSILFAVPLLLSTTMPGVAGDTADAASTAKPLAFSAAVDGPILINRVPSGPYFARALDLDGDRRSEIVLTYFNWPPDNPKRAEPVKILKVDPKTFTYAGSGSTLVSGTMPAFVHPRVTTTGDYDGDGRPDLFIGGHGYDQMPAAGEKDRLLLSAPGPIHRAVVAAPGVDTFTHAAASGDIDGDGLDDIYVGVICCSTQGPYFLMGRKGAAPVVDQKRLGAQVAQRLKTYTAAVLTDVNGDGRPDLVLGVAGDERSVIYLNDKSGSFARDNPDRILPDGLFGATNTIVLDMFATDLDFDGKPDLVLLETANDYTGYAVQILINRGGGNFVDETATRLPYKGIDKTASARLFLARSTFFGDRMVDFVTHSFGSAHADSPLIWLNDGTGRFTAHGRKLFDTVDTADDNGWLLPVGVDQDGRADLARVVFAGEQGKFRVKTYRNLGVPSGSPAVTPQVVRSPPATLSVAAGKSALLSILVRGSRPLAFQWLKNGKAIAGAVLPTLNVAVKDAAAAGTYSVVVRSRGGTVTRSTKLTVQ